MNNLENNQIESTKKTHRQSFVEFEELAPIEVLGGKLYMGDEE